MPCAPHASWLGRRAAGGKPARWLALVYLALTACGTLISRVEGTQAKEGSDNSYDAAFRDVRCYADAIAQPRSTGEVAALIETRAQAAAAAGLALKVRASHRAFHSSASFPCPGQEYTVYPKLQGVWPFRVAKTPLAASNTTSLALLMDGMSGVLGVDKERHQLRVQAGMLVIQLMRQAALANMSVPLGSIPAFADLTLGGVLSTGAHGSGLNTTSSLADILVELTWVDGRGNVHTSARDSDAGRALVSGLGVAGIVTELLLQMQPPSHTALSTRFKRSDAKLLQDIHEMLKESPHVLVVWRPDLEQYTAYVTREVPTSVPTTGGIMAMDLPKVLAQGVGLSLAAWQADIKDKNPVAALPIVAAVQEISVNHAMANTHGGRRMYEGVGDTNDMQAVSCGDKCLWNLGTKIAMDDIHMSIELSQLGSWIDDVKSLIRADLHGASGGAQPSERRMLPPGYFWFRFGRGSKDMLGHTSGLAAPVQVQASFMKSLHDPLQPGKFAWVLEVLEQLTLCKYKAKPHWGKNKQRTFIHPTCHVRDHLPRWAEMEAFRAKSDPGRIFEPALYADMAAARSAQTSAGCALRGECYCSNSSHCAPGFSCLPSLAFPEFMACRVPLA